MAISINWTTRVISIPQADLTLVSSGIYRLDLDDFRQDLNDLQDDVDGIVFPTTHVHTPETTLAGTTFARQVQIINGYTISFEENGTPYAVELRGANSNVADVTNVNGGEVSLRVFNTAGLVSGGGGGSGATPAQIADAVWDEVLSDHNQVGSTGEALADAAAGGSGGVADWTLAERSQIRDALGVDGVKVTAVGGQLQSLPTAANIADAVWDESTTGHSLADSFGQALLLSRYAGEYGPTIYVDTAVSNTTTVLGVDGTIDNPVSTIGAARTLADALGTKVIQLSSTSSLSLDQDFSGFTLVGGSVDVNNQDVFAARFIGPQIVRGTVGFNTLTALFEDVQFFQIVNPVGVFVRCNFNGAVPLIGGGVSYVFRDCYSFDENSFPTFNLAANPFSIDYEIQIHGWRGQLSITNSNRSGNLIQVDGDCRLTLPASNTAGTFVPRGNVELVNAGTATIDDERTPRLVDTVLTAEHGSGAWTSAVGGTNPSDIYDYFTDGTREDAFKADVSALATTANLSGLATSAQVAALPTPPAANDVAAAVWASATTAANTPSGSFGRALAILRYKGRRGPSVHINTAASNTGTVVGTDGTFDNPVSTLAAARTIAATIGVRRFELDIVSSITLDQAYTDFEFVGGSVALNNQDVQFCSFRGTQIVSGQFGINTLGVYAYDVQFFNPVHPVGEFYRCRFNGPVSLIGGGVPYFFVDCRAFDETSFPSFDLLLNPFSLDYEIEFRNWKGPLRLQNSNRGGNFITIDGDCRVIVDASCTAGTLTLRGNVDLVNNGTMTIIDERTPILVDERLTSTHGSGTWTTGTGGGGGGGTSNVLDTFTVAAGSTATTVLTNATRPDQYFDRMLVLIETQGGEKMARRILSYAQTDGAFVLESALPFVPGAGDTFTVIGIEQDVTGILVGSGTPP